jgi:hypothetical protein
MRPPVRPTDLETFNYCYDFAYTGLCTLTIFKYVIYHKEHLKIFIKEDRECVGGG